MNERPTPETDAFFRSFADGDATPSHAEYYDRMTQLERERDESRAEVQAIQHWATVNGTIEMQRELEQAKQDAKQHEVDCLRALGERNEALEQRDESRRLLEKWEQVAIGAGERVLVLTKQRDEAREWKDTLSLWGGTPEIVHKFIKGQQARIRAAQDIERELEQAKQDAKQHEVDCLRALGERNEARKQRDAAISIGFDAVGQLIDLHHATSKRDRNVEWECRADLLDRNFRKLEDLLDSFGHPEQTQP